MAAVLTAASRRPARSRPAPRHVGDVERRQRRLADQRREVAAVDQVPDVGLVDDAVEESPRALVEPAAVEPVGRRREARDAHPGPQLPEARQQPAVARLRRAGDEVRLVDHDEVARPDGVPLVPHRLDAADQHLRGGLAAAEAGRIDAGRRLRPVAGQLGVVLSDEFAAVGDDRDAGPARGPASPPPARRSRAPCRHPSAAPRGRRPRRGPTTPAARRGCAADSPEAPASGRV